MTFDLFFNKLAPCAGPVPPQIPDRRGEGPFPLKHTTPRPVFFLFFLSLFFSHTFIYAFFAGGAGCRSERSEHCLLLGVDYPMATSSPTSLSPFFSWLCVFTPGIFSGFSSTLARSARTPARLFVWLKIWGFLIALWLVCFGPVRGYQRSVRKWGGGCLMLGICFPMAPIPPS